MRLLARDSESKAELWLEMYRSTHSYVKTNHALTQHLSPEIGIEAFPVVGTRLSASREQPTGMKLVLNALIR